MTFDIENFLIYFNSGNRFQEYLLAFEIFIILIFILRIFKYIIIERLKNISAKTHTKYDDYAITLVDRVGWLFYVALSFYISIKFIQIPVFIETYLNFIFIVIFIYYAIIIIEIIMDYGVKKITIKRKEYDKSTIYFLSKFLKGLLWTVGFIFILSFAGYNVSTILAGLGIGGIAIAFALQNVLGDIFASFSIYFDKPFKIGDFIIIGNDLGTVKKIGIKTTRIESLWGQEIVIPNKDMTASRINNYKKMKKRRVQFGFGVIYETRLSKLKKINNIIRDIFAKIPMADLDRVHFKEYGDFSQNFEVVYYVNTGDYNKYMDIQQKVNFAIKEEFEKEGIEFAYPTQKVLIDKKK